jgi:hypothetical protein
MGSSAHVSQWYCLAEISLKTREAPGFRRGGRIEKLPHSEGETTLLEEAGREIRAAIFRSNMKR